MTLTLPPPETQPCPFDVFEHSNNPALSQTKVNDMKTRVLNCLANIRGYRITLSEATCDELMCAYHCNAEHWNFVRFIFL